MRQEPALHGVERPRRRRRDLRRAVPAVAAYSAGGLSRALKRRRLRLKRGRRRLHSPDPAYAAKVARAARARARARAHPARATVLDGDEVSFYRQPTLAATWAPVGREPTAMASH